MQKGTDLSPCSGSVIFLVDATSDKVLTVVEVATKMW